MGGGSGGCPGRAFWFGVLELGACWWGLGVLGVLDRVGAAGGAVFVSRSPVDVAF